MPEITLTEQSDLEIYRELSALGCFCYRPKKSGNTFCYRCYQLLPRTMQLNLYNEDIYPLAVRRAKAFLVEKLKARRG